MAQIVKPNDGQMLNLDYNIALESRMIPNMRFLHAQERGLLDNVMLAIPHSIGDAICCEPVISWMVRNMPKTSISVATKHHRLFRHLKVSKYVERELEKDDEKEYMILSCLHPEDDVSNSFYNGFCVQHVDLMSLHALGRTIPNSEKAVRLEPLDDDFHPDIDRKTIVIHPGNTWESRTPPKEFWNLEIDCLTQKGHRPVLIGGEPGAEKGTVEVNPSGCLDLRGKLSLMQGVAACQAAGVVLTNDSAPLHMASSWSPGHGGAHVGFVSTCKEGEYVTHWRRAMDNDPQTTKWGWRMQDFARGGMWHEVPQVPNRNGQCLANISKTKLKSWLPPNGEMARWAHDRIANRSGH